jgi:hypothetical protein
LFLIDIAIFPKIRPIGTFKDVVKHILAMDDKLCTEIFLINLISCLPSHMDDKVKLETFMNASEEECEKLDQPEQFILQVRERDAHKSNC